MSSILLGIDIIYTWMGFKLPVLYVIVYHDKLDL